ncbi:hypothetical protein B0T18DRAFT_459113, partial [Schizothecium vesticola]
MLLDFSISPPWCPFCPISPWAQQPFQKRTTTKPGRHHSPCNTLPTCHQRDNTNPLRPLPPQATHHVPLHQILAPPHPHLLLRLHPRRSQIPQSRPPLERRPGRRHTLQTPRPRPFQTFPPSTRPPSPPPNPHPPSASSSSAPPTSGKPPSSTAESNRTPAPPPPPHQHNNLHPLPHRTPPLPPPPRRPRPRPRRLRRRPPAVLGPRRRVARPAALERAAPRARDEEGVSYDTGRDASRRGRERAGGGVGGGGTGGGGDGGGHLALHVTESDEDVTDNIPTTAGGAVRRSGCPAKGVLEVKTPV